MSAGRHAREEAFSDVHDPGCRIGRAINERLEVDSGVSYRPSCPDFSPVRPDFAGGGEP